MTPDDATSPSANQCASPPPYLGKPAFWWAFDREPWKRVSTEITASKGDLAKEIDPAKDLLRISDVCGCVIICPGQGDD
jgi:hypothetical protein